MPKRRKLSVPLFLAPAIALGACERAGRESADPALVAVLREYEKRPTPAGKYVVRGREGHLFYLEDLRAAVCPWLWLDSNAAMIGRLAARLKDQGVRFLVVPVPTKPELYPELLGGHASDRVCASRDKFLKALAALGAEAVDLRPALLAAKPGTRLYGKSDTHWDEGAIEVAAGVLADRLGGHASSEGRAVTDTVITGFRGDLSEKFPEPDIHGVTDTVRLRRVGAIGGGPWAEPDSADVILYGDSFLNQYKRFGGHLGAHLSLRLGAPVRTIYSLSGFTQGPERIREILGDKPRGKTVVWVFTSRSLMEAVR